MNRSVLTVILVIGAFMSGVLLGPKWEKTSTGDAGEQADSSAKKEVLYWVAPMDPNYRRDKPGKSPMGMDLVPVYADEAATGEVITINPSVVNNIGVRTEKAQIRPLWRRVEATGYVGLDETLISYINTRVPGWIVKLLVDAEGERVSAGDLLFELYAPELVNAQKEYLQAVQRGGERLREGARQKLMALGMIPLDIKELETRGTASENIRIVAPRDGVVINLDVREGMYIQPNTTIMSLADLSSVWLQAEVFESQAEWVAEGQAVEARLDYLPGEVFTGQVDYVYPVLDPKTRTLRVRLRFDNTEGKLKPNMYAQISIYGKLQPSALSIPREALIRAPGRDRVVLALGDGRFTVHEVMTGMESGDWVEIIAGIREDDRVVTSSQFLIDSEASLGGSIRRLEALPEVQEQAVSEQVFASGKVEAVEPKSRRLRVSHGPIEALAWPSMTMEFEVDPGVRLDSVVVGQDIRFTLRQEHAGHWVVSQITGRETLGNRAPGEDNLASPAIMDDPDTYEGTGVIKEVKAEDRVLNISHRPIETLGWPAMTMNFDVAEGLDLGSLAPGADIKFRIRKGDGGMYVIVGIQVVDAAMPVQDHAHD